VHVTFVALTYNRLKFDPTNTTTQISNVARVAKQNLGACSDLVVVSRNQLLLPGCGLGVLTFITLTADRGSRHFAPAKNNETSFNSRIVLYIMPLFVHLSGLLQTAA